MLAKWNEKEVSLIKEFLESGKSIDFIASHFQTSPDNIRMVMSRNSLKVKNSQSGAPSKLNREKKIDLATRIRMLLGEELLETAREFAFTDEQIKKWLEPEGFILFAKEVLNIELQDYQIEFIKNLLNSKRACWVAGRASGKSFSISIACLYIAITRSNQKILIISPAQRQSDLLYNQVLKAIGLNNELFNSVERSNAEICRFTNNSEIYPLPATTFIRGFQRVDYIFLDESAYFMNPEETFASIEPMLSIKNDKGEYGNLVVVGSPAGKTGILWNCFNNPLYVKMQTPATINKFVSEKWIEEQKISMSPIAFETEVMAQFSEAIDNLFSYDLIRKVSQTYDYIDFPEQNKEYYFGIDVGRVRDSSVITIVSKDKEGIFKSERVVELNNKEFREQINMIKFWDERFKPRKICIEKAGLSLQMVEELKKSLSIKEFEPTIKNKEEGFNYLLKLMQEGKVIISSKDQSLQFQIRTFKYEITERGQMKLHHESEFSRDDYVDSLMMAIWATKGSGFYFTFLNSDRTYSGEEHKPKKICFYCGLNYSEEKCPKCGQTRLLTGADITYPRI